MTYYPEHKFIAIVGPTASGKTELSLRLCEVFGGEVVCADSRSIYRGMDIGTAKPSRDEQRRIRHHLLDIADPDDPMTAAVFKGLAQTAIEDILQRGNVPFLVGGSGLYAYSIIYDFQFPAGPRSEERIALEREPLAVLVERLRLRDPERANEIDLQNQRRVIRALETLGLPRERKPVLPDSVLLLGIRSDEQALESRIKQRTRRMIEAGLVEEVKRLVRGYGSDLEVLKSPGYEEILLHLEGKKTLEEAEALIVSHTRQLLKRQLTWLRRNHEIRWLDAGERDPFYEAQALVANFIG